MRRLAPALALALAGALASALAGCPAPASGPAAGPAAGPAVSIPAPAGPAADPFADPFANPFASPGAHETRRAEGAACAAFAGLPGPVVAAAPALAGAIALATDRRYELDLGAAGGLFTVTVPTAGEWSFFMTAPLLFFVRDARDEVVFPAEEGTASDQCLAVENHRVFILEPGTAYAVDCDGRPGERVSLFVTETHPTPR